MSTPDHTSDPPSSLSSFRRDMQLHSSMSPYAIGNGHAERPTSDGDFVLRELLESTADGVYGLDSNGYVTYVNPAARRMTGWSIEDLRGRTQHSMVHHSHADGTVYPREECPIYAALRDGRVHRRENEVFWRKDGSHFPVAYTSSPIFREGKPAGAVIVFRDLSLKVEDIAGSRAQPS